MHSLSPDSPRRPPPPACTTHRKRLRLCDVGLNFRALQAKLFETGIVQDYLDAFFPGVIDERDVRRPPAHFFLAG